LVGEDDAEYARVDELGRGEVDDDRAPGSSFDPAECRLDGAFRAEIMLALQRDDPHVIGKLGSLNTRQHGRFESSRGWRRPAVRRAAPTSSPLLNRKPMVDRHDPDLTSPRCRAP
jgi:hypothetical protein